VGKASKRPLTNFLPQLLKGNGHKTHFVPPDENRLVYTENWLELQNAILTLKPHFRSIVILRALKETSIKETAEILGCSEGKVRVYFHRAINQLKKELVIIEGGDYREESKSL